MTIKHNASTKSIEGEWVNIPQAAERLGVSTRTVQRYIRAGKLNVQREDGRRVRVKVPALSASVRPAPAQDLQTLIMKVDHLSELVKTAIRLYAPKTLEEVRKKWI